MDIYSIISLIIRLILVFFLFQTGKLALNSRTRTISNIADFLSAVGLLLGFWFGLFTLILLVMLGLKIWSDRKKRLRLGRDLLIFVLTFIIFLKGPGVISLDKLLGNI